MGDDKLRPTLPKGLHPGLAALCRATLDAEPETRPVRPEFSSPILSFHQGACSVIHPGPDQPSEAPDVVCPPWIPCSEQSWSADFRWTRFVTAAFAPGILKGQPLVS